MGSSIEEGRWTVTKNSHSQAIESNQDQAHELQRQ